MSSAKVQTRSRSVTTVTVVMLAVISVAALLQVRAIPPVLAFPLFLMPVSIYATVLAFASRHEAHKTDDHSYHFTWAGIMMAVGAGWIVLYEGMGAIIGAIVVLSVALAYLYLDKMKSSMVAVI